MVDFHAQSNLAGNTLDLDSAFQSLAFLLRPGDSFLPHDASTPVTFGLLVLLGVAFPDSGNELRELRLVF